MYCTGNISVNRKITTIYKTYTTQYILEYIGKIIITFYYREFENYIVQQIFF
jgi:hypothetical protein